MRNIVQAQHCMQGMLIYADCCDCARVVQALYCDCHKLDWCVNQQSLCEGALQYIEIEMRAHCHSPQDIFCKDTAFSCYPWQGASHSSFSLPSLLSVIGQHSHPCELAHIYPQQPVIHGANFSLPLTPACETR